MWLKWVLILHICVTDDQCTDMMTERYESVRGCMLAGKVVQWSNSYAIKSFECKNWGEER